MEPRIVHLDRRFVVVDKPAGMLAVPGKREPRCVSAWVRERVPWCSGPLVVHRLDMDTSGLMVLGLDPEAQRLLSAQFERREVEKAYTALVAGEVEGERGVVELPMRADIEHRPTQIIDFERGRPSATRWRVLAREIDRTRVRFEPVTGRTHQIRVHAASARVMDSPTGPRAGGLGCPILGDVLYARPTPEPEVGRLMLHAGELSFREPREDGPGPRVEFRSQAEF